MPFVPVATEAYWQSYLEALDEGFFISGFPRPSADELAAAKAEPATFFAALRNPPSPMRLANGECVDRPPTTVLWWVDGPDFIGAIEIRHVLSSAMVAAYGGHMSVGIRPSRKGRGYFKQMRPKALEIAAGLGIERLMVTVRADNVAARRVIEASGAIFMDEVPVPYSKHPAILRRYINALKRP